MNLTQASDAIGFVGAGRMAQALAAGISKQATTLQVHFFDPSVEAAKKFMEVCPQATTADSLSELAGRCRVLLLAVKPQVMPNVLQDLGPSVVEQHLVISVAAGISIQQYLKQLPTTKNVIRVMPNTPCLIGQGMSAVSAAESVSQQDCEFAEGLLRSVGQVVMVPESMMDAVTGLSGSGPAYVFTMIESLIAGAVKQGLPIETARQLTLQTIIGATALAAGSEQSPAELTAQVTSPGGTTLAGLEALQQGNFKSTIESAVAAATQRSIELSKSS